MKFSVVFCQNAFYASRGAFGGLNEVWDNFWQFWHKFVAWVSIMLSTFPQEPFEEENASTNFYSLTFFRARSSSDFWRFLHPQGCQTCNLRDRKNFRMKSFLWENYSSIYIFSVFEWKILGFLSVFWQGVKIAFHVCIGIFRENFFFQQKSTLLLVFGPQQMDCEKAFCMLVKTASYASRGTFRDNFLNM